MQIKESIHQPLDQLTHLLIQMENDQYTKSIQILNGQTIGKHVRHIVEFYQSLTNTTEYISYDERVRDERIENSIPFTLHLIIEIKEILKSLDIHKELHIEQLIAGDIFTCKTTIGRELLYCIDHAIHHMAIIKMAILDEFPELIINESFGIAYSTLNYQAQN